MHRLLPAPRNGGFALDDYWVWCGSVIQGEDGRYHMFASRWPREYPFFEGYPTTSEVVRAVSHTPIGPYRFEEVVLPPRGPQHWDGRMTHNPTIHKWRDTYLLFYIGSTFSGPSPTPREILAAGRFCAHPATNESYNNIRIGLATSRSILGPWQRREQPILLPRPGKWDHQLVTNPAPCVLPDGSILLLYRSNTPNGQRIGAARAEDPDSPFRRISDHPVLVLSQGFVEDPYLWWAEDHFEMIAKDCTGAITGEQGAGVHALSQDALNFTLSQPPLAYSRRVLWDDGTTTLQGAFERPQLLIENGCPTHLFAATGDGSGDFHHFTRTWNMVVPLAPCP